MADHARKAMKKITAKTISKAGTNTNTTPVSRTITDTKLEKYFSITGEALEEAGTAVDESTPERRAQALDFLDMARRYYDDARFFRGKGDVVNAFAALNYAHGWLDAGARSRLFRVSDSRLFTVDDS